MPATQQSPAVTTQENEVTEINFGNGRYSPLMQSVFKNSQKVFGLNAKQAEKLARQCGSDFGAAMASCQANATIARKLGKDGGVTLKDAAKVKLNKITDALFVVRSLDFAAEAGEFGFLYSGNTKVAKWEVTEYLTKYFASLAS